MTIMALGDSQPLPDLRGRDALGRSLPCSTEVREFRSDKYVGIFYFLWMNMDYVYDVSEILKHHPEARATTAAPPWGPHNAFHFWGEPLYGYYRSDDPWVLRKHAALLGAAGVDFLVFDTTNALIYENVVERLCEVFEEQRLQGNYVPRLAFMVNTRAKETAQLLYDKFYREARYPELWFHWQGKPLMLCDPEAATEEVRAYFTLRKAHWPFEMVNTHNAWHWEATYPQVYSYDQDPLRPEQVNVSAGQNLHWKTGRVEMMSTGQARGRHFHRGILDPSPEAYLHGFNFQEQWSRAFELDPDVVFITGWNEWIAMQLNGKEGPVIFCDQYNLEFSRDVEMMREGYGDNYYCQMVANIRRFKGMDPEPVSEKPNPFDMEHPFLSWQHQGRSYEDGSGETIPRDFPGCGDYHYRNASGRNDFRTLKIAHDDQNLYVYARTSEPITPHTDSCWMWLLIDVSGSDKANWEGFQFLLNHEVIGPNSTWLSKCKGGWSWEPCERIPYQVKENEFHAVLPRRVLGLDTESFALEFKWMDNSQSPGDMLDTYLHGDTAPIGRFRFRYEGR